jgi:hypothetical protein
LSTPGAGRAARQRFVAVNRVEAGTYRADRFAQQRFEALWHRSEAELARTGSTTAERRGWGGSDARPDAIAEAG